VCTRVLHGVLCVFRFRIFSTFFALSIQDDGAPPLAIPAARGLGDALPAEARAGDEAAAEVEPAAPSPAKRPPSPGRLPAEAAGGSPPKKPARVEERKEAGAVDAPAPPPNMRKPRAAHAVKAGVLTLDPSPAPTKAAGRRQGPAAPKGSAAALPAPRRPSSKPPAPPKRAALKAYRRPDGLTFPVASYAYVALTQEAAEAVGGGREGGSGGGGGGDREGAPAPLTLRQRFQAGQLGLVRIDAVWREVAPPPPKPRRPAKVGGAGDAAPPPPPAARPPPAYKFRGGWVLPPEATHAGRGAGHGHREVFISSEASTNDAACLVGPALVVRERDFARAPGDDVFFAKYEYNATWQVRARKWGERERERVGERKKRETGARARPFITQPPFSPLPPSVLPSHRRQVRRRRRGRGPGSRGRGGGGGRGPGRGR